MPDVPKAGRLFDRRWLSWDRARLDADVLDAIVIGWVISTPKQVGWVNVRAGVRKVAMERVCCTWGMGQQEWARCLNQCMGACDRGGTNTFNRSPLTIPSRSWLILYSSMWTLDWQSNQCAYISRSRAYNILNRFTLACLASKQLIEITYLLFPVEQRLWRRGITN